MTMKHMKRRKPLNADLLLDIQPLTDNQGKLFESYDEGKHIVAYGATILCLIRVYSSNKLKPTLRFIPSQRPGVLS